MMMDREMFKKIRIGIGAVSGIGAYKLVVDTFSKGRNLGLLKELGVFGVGLGMASAAMIGVDAFGKATEKVIFENEEETEPVQETEEEDDEEEDDE